MEATSSYSPQALARITEVRKWLCDQPLIQPHMRVIHSIFNPNAELARVLTLFELGKIKYFHVLIEQQADDPWNNGEVIDAAEGLLSVALVVSFLALEELETISKTADPKIFEAHARSHSHLQQVYIAIRKGWRQLEAPSVEEPLPTGYSEKFYQAGTVQNVWNSLNQEYCQRCKTIIPTSTTSWLKEDKKESPLVGRKKTPFVFTNYLTHQQVQLDPSGNIVPQRPSSAPPEMSSTKQTND